MTVEAGRGRERYAELTALAAQSVCVRCGSQPRVAVLAGVYALRCNCYPSLPILGNISPAQGERRWKMVQEQGLMKRGGTSLTRQEVKQFICPLATDAEAEIFLRFCMAQSLNPFTYDAYLIKYDVKAKAAIVIGVQAHLKRAARNPNYAGYDAGVIVQDAKGETVFRAGSFLYPGDTLGGGWAKVYLNDGTSREPVTVNLSEYNKRQAQWTEKPATMIEKVAIRQAHRRAFPAEIESLYRDVGLPVDEGEGESPGLGHPQPAPAVAQSAEGGPSEPEPDVEEAKQSLYGPPAEGGKPAGPVAHAGETPRNIGELFTWAAELGRSLKSPVNIGRAEVLGASGVSESSRLADLGQAWAQVLAVYGGGG